LIEYFTQYGDTYESDIQEAEKEKRIENESKKVAFEAELQSAVNRKKEIINLFSDGKIEIDEYNAMVNRVVGRIEFAKSELVKIHISLHESEKIDYGEVVATFTENWVKLTDIEKRQFLIDNIKKIIAENKGGYNSGITRIIKIEFNE
jgi:hypothetical protein